MKSLALRTSLGLMASVAAMQASAQTPDPSGQKSNLRMYGSAVGVVMNAGNASNATSWQAAQPKGLDFANATPMPLPKGSQAPPSPAVAFQRNLILPQTYGAPGVSKGSVGDGKQRPVTLHAPLAPQSNRSSNSSNLAVPQEFGTSQQPYTTSQASAYPVNTVQYYPFRTVGRLFFNISGSTYVCSASLIGKGLVVTAAHCVANFGQQQFYNTWYFVPAYSNGSAPYGVWLANSVWITGSYYNGSDSCAQSGVVCQNDVAILTLTPQGGALPGTNTGWMTYGWNGYSYNSSNQALITQLGYPVALDGGLYQERTDSQGFVSTANSNNTIIGSLMTGGSSGGPWVVNLGLAPGLNGVSFGNAAVHEVVVGVTSWGYNDPTIKQQGASPFTTNNIVGLVNAACSALPAEC